MGRVSERIAKWSAFLSRNPEYYYAMVLNSYECEFKFYDSIKCCDKRYSDEYWDLYRRYVETKKELSRMVGERKLDEANKLLNECISIITKLIERVKRGEC